MSTFLVCSDLEDKSRAAIERALSLAAAHEGHVVLVHVVPAGTGEAEIELARTGLSRQAAGAQVEALVREGKLHEAVARIAQRHRADLVLAGAHRPRPIGDMLVATGLQRLLRATGRALLVVKQPVAGPYRRVVVASDLTDASHRAVRTALDLGLLDDAEVTLLHVFTATAKPQMLQVGIEPAVIDEHVRRAARDANADLQAFAAGLGITPGRLRLEAREGRPAEVVEQVAASASADLVVVGTRALTGLRHLTLGSVADQVLARVACDVLAVPPQR